MMRRVTIRIILTSLAAFSQPATPPSFDVASIRLSEPGRESIEHVPGSLTMRHVRLTACIRWAYGIQEYQVSGPGWLNDIRVDIVAKAGTPVPEAELRRMLQTLLTERFKLAVHRQAKEIPALILTLGKNGHKAVQLLYRYQSLLHRGNAEVRRSQRRPTARWAQHSCPSHSGAARPQAGLEKSAGRNAGRRSDGEGADRELTA